MRLTLTKRFMADLSIPKEEFPVLATIIDLDQRLFLDFSKALSEIIPPLGREKYISIIADKVPQIRTDEIKRIINTVIALYRVKEKIGVSAVEMANLMKVAAQESEHDHLFQGDRAEILAQRLTTLLGFENTLGLGTKCVLAMLDNEHVCLRPEMRSDMRPVFDGAEEKILAGAITHHLTIVLNGDDSDLHITLDDNDLEKLKEEIEKSQKKSLQLKAFLKSSNLFFLE